MFRLLLILIITAMNLAVALLPVAIILGLLNFAKIGGIFSAIKFIILAILLVYSAYLIFDFIFGINMKLVQIIKKSYRFGGEYKKKLELPLKLVQTKYQLPRVKLFITDSKKPENYAMASAFEKYICISVGMINALEIRAKSPEEFQILASVVLAKQAYNLRSGNYLPSMLFRNNQRVIGFIEKCTSGFFKVLCIVIKQIPIIGLISADALKTTHTIITFILKAINKALIKIYQGITFLSVLSIQAKSDVIAAKIIGGKYVAHALAITEEENIEIFTWKPRLRHRIAKIETIERTKEIAKIHPIYQILYSTILIFVFALTFFLAKPYIL